MPFNIDPYLEPMFTKDMIALSNFDETAFYVPSLGIWVKSNEHLYNMYKTLIQTERDKVLAADSPGKAKGIGRRVTLRPGWDNGVRLRAMQTGLLTKFAVPELREVLDSTGTLHLIETNRHHDSTWGHCIGGGRTPCKPRCAHPGQNMLGELLMALRCRTL